MKTLITIEGDVTCLKQKCFCCSSKGHLAKECPSLHYIPDKEKVIKKYDYSHPQKRTNKFSRRLKRAHNARFIKKSLNEINQVEIDEDLEKNGIINNIDNFEGNSLKNINIQPNNEINYVNFGHNGENNPFEG